MIIVEVKSLDGRILDRRKFSVCDTALEWFEKAKDIYGQKTTLSFGIKDRSVVREHS